MGFTTALLFVSFLAFAQNQVQDYEPLDTKQVMNDVREIKAEMDSTFYYAKETFKLLKEEVQLFGFKKTIQINSDIFFQYVIVAVLYILWRLKRKK